MLVEDLARAFYLVLQDYERFKIDNLFVAAQAALAARTGNAANYNTHADTVRRGAMDLTQQSNYAYFPQRWKDLFEASRFASASPERLGKMLLAALPGDPQRAISSGELNGDMDTYKNARNTMNAFLGACSTVNIGRWSRMLAGRTSSLASASGVTKGTWRYPPVFLNGGALHSV